MDKMERIPTPGTPVSSPLEPLNWEGFFSGLEREVSHGEGSSRGGNCWQQPTEQPGWCGQRRVTAGWRRARRSGG